MAEYRGPIIDAHQHLWDFGMDKHPWLRRKPATDGGGDLPMGDLEPVRRDYLVADYLADAEGQGVVATVHVEATWDEADPLSETRWIESLDRGQVALRHVFHVDLASADAGRLLAIEMARPGASGIRDIVAWHPDPARSFSDHPGRMSNPAWRSGLAHLHGTGMTCELLLFPWQMDEAEHLVQDFGDIPFVLNHCGSPLDRSDSGMADWAKGLQRLGRLKNLYLKISNPFAYDHGWTLSSLRRVVAHCLDCFRSDRVIFGTDFPVAGLQASYAELMTAYRALTADMAPGAQRAFFHDNAKRLYRFGDLP